MEDTQASSILQILGKRIRALRTEQGFSQEAFADRCGLHRTFMGTVERGESNLSFQNILKVASTLGVTLSALFLDIERAEPQNGRERANPLKSVANRTK